MKQDNYQFLERQLKYTGFPESLNKDLKENMEDGKPAFVLTHQMKSRNNNADIKLFFKRPEESDTYFFNSYRVTVKTDRSPEGLSRTFPIDNKKKEEGVEDYKKNITVLEAFNFLAKADNPEEQRFVYGQWMNKQGNIQNAWKGLNLDEKDKNGNYEFKTFYDSYGFNLDKSIADLPIDETYKYDPNVIRSLQRGNLHSVIDTDGNQMYISAFPPAMRINLFDANMNLVNGKESKEALSLENSINNGPAQQIALGNERTSALVGTEESKGKQSKNESSQKHTTDRSDDLETTARKRSRGR
jgi:hypothetical protein